MVKLFDVATRYGMDGVVVDYIFIKDFCEKHSLESVDTFELTQRIAKSTYSELKK